MILCVINPLYKVEEVSVMKQTVLRGVAYFALLAPLSVSDNCCVVRIHLRGDILRKPL